PEVVSFCVRNSIAVEAWAPIMRGRVNDVAEIQGIASRHDKTPAQVTLRWILQRGIVAIPKSVHADRIAENADVFDFVLSSDEMATMDRLDSGERIGPSPDRPPP
ncbi:MAG: aldo/keto reductase, partial [Coriobacteriia bacterium]|nr:aldo/keto reductase [Coriobacteriia bacterium]